MTVALSVTEWQRLGVRLPDGRTLPGAWPDASLVSGTSRHFLVHHNYDALLDYNCAHSYAIGVGLLAARVNGGASPPAPKAGKRTAASPPKKTQGSSASRH
jgi:membrane-bound lytic murein transglycosylase B